MGQVKSATNLLREELKTPNENMYVIEREIPGAGNLTSEELQAISQTSCGVLGEMGSDNINGCIAMLQGIKFIACIWLKVKN